MKNAKIYWYYGELIRGRLRAGEELHASPHPREDFRLDRISPDEVFSFIADRRADVERTRAIFGKGESWKGELEFVDPIDGSLRAIAAISLVDLGVCAAATIDGLVERSYDGEVDSIEPLKQTLIVIPVHDPSVTSRRVAAELPGIPETHRRRIIDRVSAVRKYKEWQMLAFGVAQGSPAPKFHWFQTMLIRAVVGWQADLDRLALAQEQMESYCF